MNEEKTIGPSYIIAEGEKEKEIFNKIRTIVTLINSFKGNKSVNLNTFITPVDSIPGHVTMAKVLRPEDWKAFVALQQDEI